MSNIKEKLRSHKREYPSLIHSTLCGEAADEIERLEAVNAELLEVLKEVVRATPFSNKDER